jgi:flagellar basal-body rod protein FlgC
MIDALKTATAIAGGGLEAMSTRMRIVAENLANARSVGNTPGADPYMRKTVMLDSRFDRELGAARVNVKSTEVDSSTPFRIEHDPGSPAADEDGNVKLPNVDPIVEMADMREASRTYQANLQMIRQTRSMISMTIDLLRSGQ